MGPTTWFIRWLARVAKNLIFAQYFPPAAVHQQKQKQPFSQSVSQSVLFLLDGWMDVVTTCLSAYGVDRDGFSIPLLDRYRHMHASPPKIVAELVAGRGG